MESYFTFHTPQTLWLLVIVPFIFVFELLTLRPVKMPISSSLVVGEQIQKTWRQRFEWLPLILRAAAFLCLVVAIARPQWGNHFTQVNSAGIDIVLALDTSGSMKALDLELNGQEANRLEVVKSVVSDFVDGREFDRIGMVVFGDEAFTQCPLTLDYGILKGYLQTLVIGVAGEGTAIGNALATAVKRLETSTAKSRVVILLTDGVSNSGQVSPKIGAELAAKRGIKVYTVAIGTSGKRVPFPQKNFFGFTEKRLVQLDVDEEALQEIATITGGQFFEANDTQTLKKIYQRIDELEKTEVTVEHFSEFEELFVNFALAAVVLLTLSWLLQHSVFMRVP